MDRQTARDSSYLSFKSEVKLFQDHPSIGASVITYAEHIVSGGDAETPNAQSRPTTGTRP